MKAKRLSKFHRSSKARRLDIITTLPQTIIETILCLLPIKEAARTSILSREWRYKWTKIPELVFSELAFLERSTQEIDSKKVSNSKFARNMGTMCKLFYTIHQVLLLRQGPILDFTLSLFVDCTCFEIDQIILHLSRNHPLKKLAIYFSFTDTYGLPLSIFSLHHLRELHLESCAIDHKPIFNGFSSLTSLTLSRVTISIESLQHLLSNCPSLKRLGLLIKDEQYEERLNIMELFKCMPAIEHLTTWGYFIWMKSFDVGLVPQGLPTSLIHLKYLCFKQMDFSYCGAFTFLLVLLKCSPNLEKFKLKITSEDFDEESVKLEEYTVIIEEYSDVWLEHLNEVKIKNFTNFKIELELVKFILVRSPNLKKMILVTYIENKKEELELLHTLLRAPRASPVEIIVDNHW